MSSTITLGLIALWAAAGCWLIVASFLSAAGRHR